MKLHSWPAVLALFSVVSFVEAVGVAHVLAFAPLYLDTLGAAPVEVPTWTAIVSAGAFVVGLPLVPFWGVWADQYGRRLVIARSAYVEALVFLLVALSRTPLEFAGSVLLSGFQLGNTGVMYAALTSIVPRHRLGFALAVAGVASPLGFALGPAVAGPLADTLGLRPIYFADAVLSVATGTAVTVLFAESRGESQPAGSVWRQAWDAVTGIVRHPATRLLFLVYITVYLARQMVTPFLPLIAQRTYEGENQASVIGLLVGGTALAGALVSPASGALGDRVGYGRLLGWLVLAGAVAGLGIAVSGSLVWLAAASLLFGAALSGAAVLCIALLATTTPSAQRSPTLNLSLLPLYIGGIAGPAIGGALAVLGLRLVFGAAAVPLLAGFGMSRGLARGKAEDAEAR